MKSSPPPDKPRTRASGRAAAPGHEQALRSILDIISTSRADTGPVFAAILENACLLCEAPFAGLYLVDASGSRAHLVASLGARPEYLEHALTGWPLDNPASIPSAINSGAVVQIADLADTDLYRAGDQRRVEAVDIEGIRTFLAVPLMQGNRALGAIGLYRREVDPFSSDQIALVETFAAQAVIAIENVRQFHDLQTRLEREAATRDILEVISQSRDDEQPVFDVILENALRLCDAPFGFLVLPNRDRTHLEIKAWSGMHSEVADWLHENPFPMDPERLAIARAITEGVVQHIPDAQNSKMYRAGEKYRRKMVDDEGFRSFISVPLISKGVGIGVITLYRMEKRPFTEDEIALVETFAAQAVIAIDNVRQFREVQERLERERASREILQVISRSRDDELPVFDTILASACRLCEAPLAFLSLVNDLGTHFRVPAHRGASPEMARVWDTQLEPLEDSALTTSRAIRERSVIQVEDLSAVDTPDTVDGRRAQLVELEQVRTYLVIPLIHDSRAIGTINLYRREIRAFTPEQIELVETFAAQAVIAIENVRQFRELSTRLEREAATRQILQVISSNRDDEQPIFDTILELAARLCRVSSAALLILNVARTKFHLASYRGPEIEPVSPDNTWSLNAPLPVAEALREAHSVHIPDLKQSPAYRNRDPLYVRLVEQDGLRARLVVPLLRDGIALGAIVLSRTEPLPFTSDEIALIETFAAQAVIAIENVRQFRELQERLERETATGQVLQVISSSRDNDLPVFDTILENAARLCGAVRARLLLTNHEKTKLHVVGSWGEPNPAMPDGMVIDMIPEMLPVRCILEKTIINVADGRETEGYKKGIPQIVSNIDTTQARSVLAVPLIRDGEAIGCIVLTDRAVAAYNDNDVSLVRTFAAQAVIAIENVRQFREVQTRLERETTTKNILSVISQSRDDEMPVFDAILDGAARLCDAPLAYIRLITPDATGLELVAFHGTSVEFVAVMKASPLPLDPTQSDTARAVTERTVIHIEDLAAGPLYATGQPLRVHAVETEGMRTLLVVPLTSGATCLGTISLYRREVAPFSDDQIALVQAFAAQAVIAIENVRQFREVQQRLRRERASAEVLRVISQSRDDEKPVFDAILENACTLCNAPLAGLILGTPQDAIQTLAAHKGMFSAAIDLFESGRMRMDAGLSYAARSIIEGHLIAFEDMGKSDLYQAGSPIVRSMVDDSGIRSVLFVPLIKDGQGIGNLTLFRREVKPFAQSEISLVETFAAQAVIAIENVRQFKALETLNASLETRVQDQVGEIERMGRLKRFLPAAVADTVISSGSEKMLSSHRALLGVLFCDIRGFTAFCETAEPEETIEVLQTYHQEMGKLINAHGAGVDHRMGDGIMVLFNDPVPCDDPAGEAVRLALAMRDRMSDLCRGWKRLGHRLGFGVGVAMGYATVGMVGYEGRFDYTASGTAVNLAARLCDEAEDGEILLSPRASIAVEDDHSVESKGEVTLKGIREPVEIFRLVAV
ncbi:GAF domain-containing protein [Ruegeria marina]|uniref:Adenylate cyclase, class 3 n=1 Tax=Ruegeria marina TaxID=639004 RepID=A0A1G6NKC8_9RHOB|nr:GAF domain-containing protein [Ruegeria marina]SDC68169.1 Adenylate cyclase, class 3 [Ruegeria marina]